LNQNGLNKWLERWTGNPEVACSNPACSYITAIGEEGTHKWLRSRQKMAALDAVSQACLWAGVWS